ncbi:hypothetical protein [Parachitinimonas caeni]|uniref:Uncharacterized protein n=1 Tax=Parachitinimonas caeni TaxID=3031301 RepID=A0ABT7DXB6_9NEIS|nr:hypothetical protein [Parachitinimonas caeni]MDK2124464.1 hypothetical protein [Parachitinimonas caeni]
MEEPPELEVTLVEVDGQTEVCIHLSFDRQSHCLLLPDAVVRNLIRELTDRHLQSLALRTLAALPGATAVH